jgi:hypothetical protein
VRVVTDRDLSVLGGRNGVLGETDPAEDPGGRERDQDNAAAEQGTGAPTVEASVRHVPPCRLD